MNQIGIGLLGFGTVGAGVVEGLQKNGSLIARRIGVELVIKRIADLDLESDRGIEVDRSIMTTDAVSVIEDPAVQVVIELIGGTTVAKDLTLRALRLKKPVVTANKALLAEHGDEIFSLAEENQADLYYEASVGGGIPIIRSLREGLVGNHIESIYGILNGTCNYILTRMERDGIPFDDVLKEAQEAGYAEAEPGLDIDGIDTAHKAVILAALAYGFPVAMSDICIEGIRGIDPMDINYAKELGYRIKQLAVIKHVSDAVEVRVHPTLIPINHMLGSVSGVFNAVMANGDIVGETLYYGRGAGREPTASAVISDLADVARNLVFESESRVPPFVAHEHYGKLRSMGDVEARYYFRLSLLDEPGMMARVADILGRHKISIASIVQKESKSGEHVPVIILTHEAVESNFQSALEEMDALKEVGAKTVRYRIEDLA
ncbi:MAG: homoserine dehydrogenase [Verrucomicrobia bacterium]|nr:homoserine dehydrogenase [Verrucomicrobiota bacterium]